MKHASWDYLVEEWDALRDGPLGTTLNLWGPDGWELVCTIPNESGGWKLVYKRARPVPDDGVDTVV
jgi:hypothetical protein